MRIRIIIRHVCWIYNQQVYYQLKHFLKTITNILSSSCQNPLFSQLTLAGSIASPFRFSVKMLRTSTINILYIRSKTRIILFTHVSFQVIPLHSVVLFQVSDDRTGFRLGDAALVPELVRLSLFSFGNTLDFRFMKAINFIF